MRALHRYFTNPFDVRGISVGELLAFATDHYQRMRSVNPDGKLDARIAATEGAIEAFRVTLSEDLTGLGLRKGSKLTKRRFRRELPDRVGRVFAFMIAHFGPRSPQVRQCGKRQTFRRCTDDTLAGHLRALHRVVVEHQAQTGDQAVEIAAALIAEWAAIHQKSETATGAKTRTESERREARRQLQWELYLNLLRLVELYPRQPAKLSVYMQPHLLRRLRRRRSDGAETDADSPAQAD
jgi:hypothetical protein